MATKRRLCFWRRAFVFVKLEDVTSSEVRPALFGWSVQGVTELSSVWVSLKVACVQEAQSLRRSSFLPTGFSDCSDEVIFLRRLFQAIASVQLGVSEAERSDLS